jgi:hypothetical protein
MDAYADPRDYQWLRDMVASIDQPAAPAATQPPPRGVGRETAGKDIYGNPGGSLGPNNPNAGGGGPAKTIIGYRTGYKRGGFKVTYAQYSDGTESAISEERDRGAGDAVESMFQNLGLDQRFSQSLRGVIDQAYNSDRAPTQNEIMAAVRGSDAYKQRFKANEIIRQRMADGEGRAGDRILSPAEYIDAEQQYRRILADADMPEGFYDSPDDFVGLISNSVSANEFSSRVDTAFDALNYADENTVSALRDYYNLSTSDMVSYLLDPSRALPAIQARAATRSRTLPAAAPEAAAVAGDENAAMAEPAAASPRAMAMPQMRSFGQDTQGNDVSAEDGTGAYGGNSRETLQRMYRASKYGGFGKSQGLRVGREFSEEVAGQNQNEDVVKRSFKQAAEQNPAVGRLGRLYGQPMDFQDLIREDLDLAGGAASGRRRRKFASKERAQFGQQSGLGRSSLRRRTDV